MKGDKAEVRKLDKKLRKKQVMQEVQGRGWIQSRQENKRSTLKTDNPRALANDLNTLYTGFRVTDYSSDCDAACRLLGPSSVWVKEQDVTSCFLRLNPFKPPGPDGLRVEHFNQEHHSWGQCSPVSFTSCLIAGPSVSLPV